MNLAKKALLTIAIGSIMACSLAVGVFAAGSDVWNYGMNNFTNTTYSEYYTTRCLHYARAWGATETTVYNAPGGFANARVAIGNNNGWDRWDG